VKLPDKVWLKNTVKFYAYFCLLFWLISITLVIIKTVLHGFDKVYLDIIFSLTFLAPAIVTAVFCLPELLFGKPHDR